MRRPRVLLIVSGARADVLDQCPSERIRFESLGWAILITSGMATVSMWFALYSVMGVNPYVAGVIAALWGLVIMGIDRWLITSLPIEGRRRFAMAAPRLILAVLLGTVISTPLVLRIFQSEINAQITVMKATAASNFIQKQQENKVGQLVTHWQGVVTTLEKVIVTGGVATINPASDPDVQSLMKQQAAAYQHEQTYYKQWNCQLYGGPGCPPGAGQLYKAAYSQYKLAQAEYKTLGTEIQQREAALKAGDTTSQQNRLAQAKGELPNAQQQLGIAQARLNVLQAGFDAANENENGLLIRLQALSQLSSQSSTVTGARFLLFLLFLVIECLPVTVKLLQQPGNYERILQALQEKEFTVAQRNLKSNRRQATFSPATDSGAGSESGGADDVLRIWEERAASNRANTHADDRVHPSAERFDSPHQRSDTDTVQFSPDTGDFPTVAHESLEHMSDERVPVNSDSQGDGIPLRWDDDL